MNTREAAKEYRKAQWAQIMHERAVSGDSINKFCESRGIRRNKYFYWQRKLRELACKEMIVPPGTATTAPETGHPLMPHGWAVAKAGESENESLTIEISGCKIEVTQSTDVELLAKTCRILKTIC